MKIIDVHAREILDSRGYPTVEAEIMLENKKKYRASVPSGASTGIREGLELRDNNDERFNGKGVLAAVNNINTTIKEAIMNRDVHEVDDIILQLDQTDNKRKLGVNAILPISICAFKYIIDENPIVYDKEPLIMCNIINGGAHSDNNLDIQEFMIIPKSGSIKENIRMASEIFHNLKKILKDHGYSTAVGDEGGFSPELKFTEKALSMIKFAIEDSNYVLGENVFIGLDVAASQLLKEKLYHLDGELYKEDELINVNDQIQLTLKNKYLELINNYSIISIEDPFDEKDFSSHAKLTKKIGKKVMIVGDDLFTTNKKYLQEGIDNESCNAILIKPNQIGTIKEVMETIDLARANDYKIIMSHRSGDTEDTSMSRSERTSKYNELIRIFEK